MPKSPERIEEEREERKRRIADAAMQLFAEHGFTSVSIEQIAAASGYTRVSIYNHFRGKPLIYLYLVQRGCEWLELELERRVGPELSALAAFDAYWGTFVEALNVLPGYFELYFIEREHVMHDMTEDELELLEDAKLRIERPTRALFERGIAEGLFRDVQPATAASLFFSTFAGAVLLYRTHKFVATRAQFLGAAGHYFARGLMAGGGIYAMPTGALPPPAPER